jgi:periplasmic copper chaperone A
MNPKYAAALVSIATLACVLPAAGEVTVKDAWVRGTVTGQKVTGAFMQLSSTTDAALVDASSPSAKFVEIHEMKKEGDVMKMRAIDRLPVPAGKSVDLTPGGYHMMLFDLKAPLNAGDVVPLTLTFEDGKGKKSTVDVKATVKALAAGPAPAAKP